MPSERKKKKRWCSLSVNDRWLPVVEESISVCTRNEIQLEVERLEDWPNREREGSERGNFKVVDK